MKRQILCWIAVVLFGPGYLQTSAQTESSSPPSSPASPYREVVNSYCVTCHNENLRTADLLLDQADVENVSQDPEVWNKVAEKLRAGAMPPAGMPRPDQATYDSFATYLESELDRAAEAKPNPGRPLIHRLNRAEYSNAVRDLLAVDFDAESYLPPGPFGRWLRQCCRRPERFSGADGTVHVSGTEDCSHGHRRRLYPCPR